MFLALKAVGREAMRRSSRRKKKKIHFLLMRNLGYIKRYTKCDKGSVRATDARGKKGIFMEELALVMS